MTRNWPELIQHHRLRYGLSQAEMAAQLNVSQRTVSRWERGEGQPGISQKKRLRDLGLSPPDQLLANLKTAVALCPAARALSCTEKLNLLAVSKPAIAKRPSISNWIGKNLSSIATGVLAEMLDDHALQTAINNRDVSGVITTTRSVLRTPESSSIGTFRTMISYFFHDGVRYSDAIAVAAPEESALGYQAIPADVGREF